MPKLHARRATFLKYMVFVMQTTPVTFLTEDLVPSMLSCVKELLVGVASVRQQCSSQQQKPCCGCTGTRMVSTVST